MSRKRLLGEKSRKREPAPQAAHFPFVLAVALLLLAAAVITHLSAGDLRVWPRYLFGAIIWFAAIAILLRDAHLLRQAEDRAASRTPRRSPWRLTSFFFKGAGQKTTLLSLAVVALFSVASHYDFGRFHRGGHFLHYHDVYHYYMGGKYASELGHDGLYAATHRALIENDSSFSDRISMVKNLRTYQRESAAISLQRSDSITSRFSEERWRQFKQDVLFFQSKIPPGLWQLLLLDHGFNATPFWTLVGSSFSAHLALNDLTLYLLASLDLLLIAAMLLLIAYAFDLKTCLLFAIFFFANFFASFDITGGAFLRQLWLASLIAFICFFKKGKMTAAGFCLAISVLDRVFPLVFVLLPVVLLVRHLVRERSLHRGHARLLAAFACSAVLLGGLSARTGGLAAWKDWYGKVSTHNRGFYINQISMRNLFTVSPATALEMSTPEWNEALWLRDRETRDAQSRNSLQAVRAVMLFFLIALMATRQEPDVSLAFLSFAPFILFYPANYYCVVLSVVILCWRRCFWLALTVQAMQALFWLLQSVFSTPMHLEFLHWIVALCLALVYAAFLAGALLRNAQRHFGFRKGYLAIVAGGALCVVTAVVADVKAVREDRTWVALDLTPADIGRVRRATVHSEQMASWGSGWSGGDHLVFVGQGVGAVGTVEVSVKHTGPYRVKVDYSVAPPFGVVEFSVNDQAPHEPVNLFSPRVGIRSVVYDGIALDEGINDVTFTVVGKDPAATDYHFAIDRIVISKEAGAGGVVDPAATRRSRREALDRAVSWILAHPADCFDGGRIGVCAEILALYSLSENPQLSGSRSSYLKEIRERFVRLDSARGYRTQPAEYEMLVAAAYVGRRLDIDLEAFDLIAEDVSQWAAAYYGDESGLRPLFLCEYLKRVNPTADVPCHIARSILGREYSARTLLKVLAGDVDRTTAPVVSFTLRAIAQDVCALSDFGNEPLPQEGVFADSAFWAQLCQRGIYWGRETGDLIGVARMILVAKCLNVESAVPSFQGGVRFLVQHQEPDGCFGVSSPYSPNAYRDGVLAAMMALGASL